MHLCRGVYLAVVLHHKDSLLVTAEDQIPIVEVDDSYSSSLMQDFLWFTKAEHVCLHVFFLTLQARHKMLTAAGQMQPIKDRHGNVLLVTTREADSTHTHTLGGGKWMPVSKLQSQRKSLYLGFLKLSSSVDQIRVLVSQRHPNMLCHTRVRDNGNVSRSGSGSRHWRLQSRLLRLYSQEVVELGHGVSFLLLLPAADDVCSAPGQSNAYTPLSGFLHLPLQMFELVHFCTYKEKFIGLYCRLSSLDEVRRDLRWITDALQFARYRQPRGGVPVSALTPCWAPMRTGPRRSSSPQTATTTPATH
ncbi:hypothetical protein F7725_013729 [Dissostichus mawsoni]|uniref:Uncharacterized protein n=1 Tax=Dissostichus mawsoni TaxID=36200 RepID=A0A7J5YW44_DISMA|nr:hypothetical protein F7725_013729 [Dissostichus mawsoni]